MIICYGVWSCDFCEVRLYASCGARISVHVIFVSSSQDSSCIAAVRMAMLDCPSLAMRTCAPLAIITTVALAVALAN